MKMRAFFLKHGVGKKEIVVLSLLFISFVLFIIFNNKRLNKRKSDLDRSYRYTVGVTIGKVKNLRSSGPDLDYRFMVNGITYGGRRRFIDSGSIDYNGGRYFVQFQPENPINNKILLQCPVPINIKEIPDSGWVQISCSDLN